MRLEKIRLAGFKSFVDPTTAEFPTNLVGVVGPNGCGKSNIIDAVRWVMGETSAKLLRGESMADVIFNGSATRKPVGTATVELIFDNSDGSVGGQYASYSQISIKRQVSRDGQSTYFFNGSRCRRRDIMDVFLGTGLSPRSYSIIEQGMISRVVEARPEELRVYLEEAAGISKYKERRRETENRIRHTRTNLERLDDLIEEVAKQLQHLERQAAAAEKYKRLKTEERQLRGEWLSLRWRDLEHRIKHYDRQLTEQDNKLEAAISKQRKLEADIENQRNKHTEANDELNKVQGRYYAIGSEIARLEQAIQYARETRAKQQADLEQLSTSLEQLHLQREQDESRLQELISSQDVNEKNLGQVRSVAEQLSAQLVQAEEAMHAWQQEWDEFIQQANEPAQAAQVERTRINHIESETQKLYQRLERNAEEKLQHSSQELSAEIDKLRRDEEELNDTIRKIKEQLLRNQDDIRQSRQRQVEFTSELDGVLEELQACKGRLASLETLQQAALGQDEEGTTWLSAHGLAEASRLAQSIEVDDYRWNTAVETVLGHYLQAVCVNDITSYSEVIGALDKGMVELLEMNTSMPARVLPDSLLHQVKTELDLSHQLGQVRVVNSLHMAFTERAKLSEGESYITLEGVWVGPNWVRFGREQDSRRGLLEREHELRELSERQFELDEYAGKLRRKKQQIEEQLQEQEGKRESYQRQLAELTDKLSELHFKLSAKLARSEQAHQRFDALEQESIELNQQLQEGQQTMKQSRTSLQRALKVIEIMTTKREQLISNRDSFQATLEAARTKVAEQRARTHELSLQVESTRVQQQSLEETRQRMLAQIEQTTLNRDALVQAVETTDIPIREQQIDLNAKLQDRLNVESELNKARRYVGEITSILQEMEHERHAAEELVQRERAALDSLRMECQEVSVRAITIEEQINEGKHDKQQLLERLDVEAKAKEWSKKVEKISAQISRLGPINLAAIDEFSEQKERMEYLNSQHSDITRSLETLEKAIHKIDHETRTRFKETFDQVNAGIEKLFPKLFGGGHAYLELTGEDLLDTGVTVMARPPGKRNSNIHLLSGGEKALTAVAMVFAIFHLNPAPFCLLDEVDAPLDDTNVGRYCQMVKEMSEQVQFIFITHNKITMELSNQLQGVTMHEAGVSRLVSVDVTEATKMAAM